MPTKPEAQEPPATEDEPEAAAAPDGPILEVEDLSVHFALQGNALSRLLGLRSPVVKAVDGIDLAVGRGEVVGLVGESGSGKTTLGRALLGLAPITAGHIRYAGRHATGDVATMRGAALRRLRTDIQMVFQDPTGALNPSMTIEEGVGHPLLIHGLARGQELRERVVSALERAGLAPAETFLDKYPRDLSGGQKQRAVIARAIILDPEVLVADEPISMLDMSVRAKILQLMLDLKRDLGLTYVYITHDLASAKFFCDRIAIMYLGRIVEVGTTEEIFATPRHPYTKALLAAIPEPDPERQVPRELPRGEIPDAAAPPLGCSFHPRCPVATAECGWEPRDLRALLEQHWTRVPQRYEAEAALLGDLDHLDEAATTATLGASSAEEVQGLLDGIRAEQPEEPFWQGVQRIEPTDRGVEITFVPGTDPHLRRAGGSEVACVLYGADEGTEDGASA